MEHIAFNLNVCTCLTVSFIRLFADINLLFHKKPLEGRNLLAISFNKQCSVRVPVKNMYTAFF